MIVPQTPFTQGCDLRATFERPENWPGRSVVAQTQKVLFLCNCCSTTVLRSLNHQNCYSGTTGRLKEEEWRQNHYHGGSRCAVVAEWRHSGRHNDRPMDAIGRPKKHSGGIRETEASHKLVHSVYNCKNDLRGDQWPTHVHPFCDHGDARSFLPPPLDDLWATDLLGDFFATVLNMLKPSRRKWRPWRGLAVLCATLERPKQPFCLFCASFMVAQGRHIGCSPV